MSEVGDVVGSVPRTVLVRALDCVAESVIITDAHGVVCFWNDAATTLYGYSQVEAIGTQVGDLIVPPVARAESRRVLTHLATSGGGPVYAGGWQMQDRQGRIFPVTAAATVVVDGAGAITHVIGVSTDATAGRESSRAEQTLANIVSSSSDAILTLDTTGAVTWANDATAVLFGWPPEQLVGENMSVLAPGEAGRRQAASFAGMLAGDRVSEKVTQCRHRDGSLLDVSIAPGLIRDEHGAITGMSCVIHDLTEQNALRRDRDRQAVLLEASYEQASMPQAFLDMAANVVSVNDAYCRLTGLTDDVLIGQRVESLAHWSDTGAGVEALAALTAGTRESTTYERFLQHRDGHAIPVLVDVSVVRAGDGEPYGMACFVHDLSEIRNAEHKLMTQEALFRGLGRRATDVAIVADAETKIVYVSASITDILGYRAEDFVGQVGWGLVHPDDMPEVSAAVARVSATPGASETFTARIKDAHGHWRWMDETLTNFLDDPAIAGLVANLRDVTSEFQALADLRHSEARYRAIAETAQEGILVLAASGTALFVNQTLADLVGLSLADAYRQTTRSLFDPETAQALEDKLRRRGSTGSETYEVAYAHPDGTQHLLSLSAAPLPLPDTTESGSLVMVSDVTEARRAETELRRLALHDPLTGLPNRVLLIKRLEIAAVRAARDGHSVAIIVLDLDQFKQINDSRGHESGDVLLIEVAARLQVGVRPSDTVARIGGDEFAVLCEDIDEAAAVVVATRLRMLLRRPIDVHGHRFYVDASMGLAMCPPHDPSELMRFADAAMYEAKYEGRGRVKVYDPAVAIGVDRKLAVATALREALDSDLLDLHYQPIVGIESGAMEGVEALLRWTDRKLGKVSPDEIVLAADERGMSFELDAWVLRRACRDMASLADGRRSDGLYLAVNVSARNIAGADFRDLVDETVRTTGWPAAQLTLEVTETAIMVDPASARASLANLRAKGVAIAIDDFGTGYSSLAYLRRLPVCVLKIDRSFIEQVDVDVESLAIARSIIELAGALGLQTLAEGIETAEQAEVVLSLGCTTGQGFLWSPAVPPQDLLGLDCHRDSSVVRRLA
jgi:diguanylate cyclase (GGDEF)-like protein/PAS domain S-box-containing protein